MDYEPFTQGNDSGKKKKYLIKGVWKGKNMLTEKWYQCLARGKNCGYIRESEQNPGNYFCWKHDLYLEEIEHPCKEYDKDGKQCY
jgi:hypothetical protein